MAADSMWINAPAKINIGLDVTGKREDGYHEIRTIMQSIKLFDRLTLTKTRAPGVRLSTNLKFLPTDDNNLIVKSAKMLIKEFDLPGGLNINLEKRIPVAAGMAGGSTDAASTMLAINQMYDMGLKDSGLMKRAVKLGADIPYCIMKGTALAEGIGEKLSTVPKLPGCTILLVKPKIHVSTKDVYGGLVLNENTVHPDIDKMIDAMKNKSLKTLCDNMGNILESVTISLHPEIADIKQFMLDHGALGSLMSGSGPTVFGIYKDKNSAQLAKEEALKAFDKSFAFVTELYR
ncbi:MAG: 4-(cytidine 5'-diphospho)-2-C-methyl-D-erythritol kinase [Eubacterium sp.]|nr:4-(cytidine 5'-diphospho)-2-C-methyl-D-erythritol kinase [Eubacterium sp.]